MNLWEKYIRRKQTKVAESECFTSLSSRIIASLIILLSELHIRIIGVIFEAHSGESFYWRLKLTFDPSVEG
jgi:hypothetical protein